MQFHQILISKVKSIIRQGKTSEFIRTLIYLFQYWCKASRVFDLNYDVSRYNRQFITKAVLCIWSLLMSMWTIVNIPTTVMGIPSWVWSNYQMPGVDGMIMASILNFVWCNIWCKSTNLFAPCPEFSPDDMVQHTGPDWTPGPGLLLPPPPCSCWQSGCSVTDHWWSRTITGDRIHLYHLDNLQPSWISLKLVLTDYWPVPVLSASTCLACTVTDSLQPTPSLASCHTHTDEYSILFSLFYNFISQNCFISRSLSQTVRWSGLVKCYWSQLSLVSVVDTSYKHGGRSINPPFETSRIGKTEEIMQGAGTLTNVWQIFQKKFC